MGMTMGSMSYSSMDSCMQGSVPDACLDDLFLMADEIAKSGVLIQRNDDSEMVSMPSAQKANDTDLVVFDCTEDVEHFLDTVSAETILVGHSTESDLHVIWAVHLRVIGTRLPWEDHTGWLVGREGRGGRGQRGGMRGGVRGGGWSFHRGGVGAGSGGAEGAASSSSSAAAAAAGAARAAVAAAGAASGYHRNNLCPHFGLPRRASKLHHTENILTRLSASGRHCTVVLHAQAARPDLFLGGNSNSTSEILCLKHGDLGKVARREVCKPRASHQKVDAQVGQVHESLPANTLLLILKGCGDTPAHDGVAVEAAAVEAAAVEEHGMMEWQVEAAAVEEHGYGALGRAPRCPLELNAGESLFCPCTFTCLQLATVGGRDGRQDGEARATGGGSEGDGRGKRGRREGEARAMGGGSEGDEKREARTMGGGSEGDGRGKRGRWEGEARVTYGGS
ncbi:unnamed protein product [Closterium sp. NIES-64]|nr:unnamed protein product [Closterium sp. NIES-64]